MGSRFGYVRNTHRIRKTGSDISLCRRCLKDYRLLLLAGSGAVFGEPSHEPGSLSQENGPEPLESPGASSSKVLYVHHKFITYGRMVERVGD